MNSIIVAQVICTIWSKRFRGGAQAALRNSVPERLALPPLPVLPDNPIVSIIHQVAYGERNAFVAYGVRTAFGNPRWDRILVGPGVSTPLTPAVGLHCSDDEDRSIRIVFESPHFESFYPVDIEQPAVVELRMGAPFRRAPRSPFALQCGEWGQIRYMGRWNRCYKGEMAEYQKWVCNVAWLPADAPMSPNLFLETQPSRRFDSLPDVW